MLLLLTHQIISQTLCFLKDFMCNLLPLAIHNEYATDCKGNKMNIGKYLFYSPRKGGLILINYEPFWDTLQKKDITKYQLIYHWGISSNTLRRMGHNEPINSNTLNELCLILNCQVQDIIKFEPSDAEIQQIADRKATIMEKFKHKK